MGIGDSEPGTTSNPNMDRGVGRGRSRGANRWRDEPQAAAEPVAPPPESAHCSSQQEELGPVERHLQELVNANLKKNNGTIDNETIREILNYVTVQDLSKYTGLRKQGETTAEERHADFVPRPEECATLQEDVHEIKTEPKESAATQDIGQTVESKAAQTAETKPAAPEPAEPNEEEVPKMTVRERFPGQQRKMIIGPRGARRPRKM